MALFFLSTLEGKDHGTDSCVHLISVYQHLAWLVSYDFGVEKDKQERTEMSGNPSAENPGGPIVSNGTGAGRWR